LPTVNYNKGKGTMNWKKYQIHSNMAVKVLFENRQQIKNLNIT
jgi:hypothetical protein